MAEENNVVLQFIDEYRSLPVLWDSKHKDYFSKFKRRAALNVLGSMFNMEIVGVKQKIKNLRTYFSKERKRILASRHGCGPVESYSSQWFAYEPLLFLAESAPYSRTTPTQVKVKTEVDLSPDDSAGTQVDETSVAQLFPDAPTPDPPPTETRMNVNPFDGGSAEVSATRRRERAKRRYPTGGEDEPYKFMKTAADARPTRDEWSTFASFVADNIRKLNPRHRILAKQYVCNCLFELQLKEYGVTHLPPDRPSTSQHPQPALSTASSDGFYDSDSEASSSIFQQDAQ